jgi:hypothetical protein
VTVETRRTPLRRLLCKPESVHKARALLAEEFGKFTLLPVSDSEKLHYKAAGLRVDGAGGPACTERLPVRFE